MVKGLEGIKGINWEVKEGEHILGRYTDCRCLRGWVLL